VIPPILDRSGIVQEEGSGARPLLAARDRTTQRHGRELRKSRSELLKREGGGEEEKKL
jgi:hypothetical protein